MKLQLKVRCFNMPEEIQVESQDVMDKLTLDNFQGCVKTCWNCCIQVKVVYFKGDGEKQEFW